MFCERTVLQAIGAAARPVPTSGRCAGNRTLALRHQLHPAAALPLAARQRRVHRSRAPCSAPVSAQPSWAHPAAQQDRAARAARRAVWLAPLNCWTRRCPEGWAVMTASLSLCLVPAGTANIMSNEKQVSDDGHALDAPFARFSLVRLCITRYVLPEKQLPGGIHLASGRNLRYGQARLVVSGHVGRQGRRDGGLPAEGRDEIARLPLYFMGKRGRM
jgi:hypothetical protein